MSTHRVSDIDSQLDFSTQNDIVFLHYRIMDGILGRLKNVFLNSRRSIETHFGNKLMTI